MTIDLKAVTDRLLSEFVNDHTKQQREMLYHYTTASGLLGILKSKGDSHRICQ